MLFNVEMEIIRANFDLRWRIIEFHFLFSRRFKWQPKAIQDTVVFELLRTQQHAEFSFTIPYVTTCIEKNLQNLMYSSESNIYDAA